MKVYVNNAGQIFKGAKPEGMSATDFHATMLKKGFELKEVSDDEEVDVSALEKALNQLNEYAIQADPQAHREALLQKALNGEISDEENAALRSMLAGEDAADKPQPLAKSVGANLSPEGNDTFAKSLDVSEYLASMHQGTQTALEQLGDVIEKSDRRDHEFQVLLAKSVVQIGQQVDQLTKALDSWGEQSSSRGRAVTTPKEAALAKSFANQPPEGDRLSKSEILDTLEAMHMDSIQKGNGGMARCGEDLQQAIAKYEQTMRMSRPLIEELKTFRTSRS
jgi:hypothetical protein